MKLEGPLLIAADHPSFAGHFPQNPVLAGAILIDETLQAITRARGIDPCEWRIAAAKFLSVVRPGEKLWLEHDASEDLIRFSIHAEDRKVASGTLTCAPRFGAA
jgi:3-hydroxymyristoyl/3-hydroxydecanoyl-(acyl carrier protein) dehydratase